MSKVKKVPDIIRRYYYPKNCLEIRYDKDVDEKDKIPGLVEFLKCEYEQLLESNGRFILSDNLFEIKMQPIPVILSDKPPKDKGYRMSDDWVTKTIVRELQKECSKDKMEEVVKRILKDRSFNPPIIGRYFPNSNQFSERDCDDNIPQGPYIELYYRNSICPAEEYYKACLSACLAHEYFHFIQDSYLGIDLNKTGLKNQAVIESLADFFSFAYCLSKSDGDTHTRIEPKALKEWAKKRSDIWRYRFGSRWPYSFAYCFLYISYDYPMHFSDSLEDYYNYGCIDKFNMVMYYCQRSMREAYDELTDKDNFDLKI